MKLLIVDDHDINLRVLRAQLEAEGQQVVEAVDGVEALEILHRVPVDGVISDILMPRMDGYRLCMEVRRDPSLAALPFILYTSTYNSPSDRKLAESVGADAYIAKPAPCGRLIDAVMAAGKTPRPPAIDAIEPEQPAPLMKQYSEVLIRKLEEKGLELERTHEGLVESRARLSGLIASAMDAIIAVDERQDIVLFNAAAGEMFGCDPEHAMGRPIGDFISMRSGRASALPLAALAREAQRGRTLGREVQAMRADGTTFSIEAKISRLPTSQGDVFTLFIRDVTERLKAEAALAESAAGLKRAQDLAQLSHAIVDAEGLVESVSDSFARLFGMERRSRPRSMADWVRLVHPDDRARVAELMSKARKEAKRLHFEYRLDSGGKWRNIKHIIEPLEKTPGGSAGIRTFNTLQDITAQKKIEKRILRLNRVYAVLSGINSLIVRVRDRDELFRQACRIVVETGGFSKAWIGVVDETCAPVRIVGWAGAEDAFFQDLQQRLQTIGPEIGGVLGRALSGKRPVVCNDIANDVRVLARKTLVASGSSALALLPLVLEDATIGILSIHSPIVGFFDDTEMQLMLKLADDISFALDHLMKSDRIRYLAHHDSLTGLPNRLAFLDALARRLADRGRDAPDLVVMSLDLIRFRRVNETFGRKAGDELLRMVATRLHAQDPSVARLGPDLFGLQLEGRHTAAELAREFERLSERCFGEPFVVFGEEIRIGCRIGAAVFPGDGVDAENLLLNAEEALRRAKNSLLPYVFYAPKMNATAAQAFGFESKLRRAMERDEFVLHYQPKVGLVDGRICGAEALIRWQNPEKGLIPPADFISVLEETGLIRAVGRWAVERAIADRSGWLRAGFDPVRIAVNVSPLQLNQPDFVAQIASAVGGAGGGALELEITENVIMDDIDRTIGMLDALRRLDVSVAVDDFGTGYSSLSYIAKLPITSLKIDRAFVAGMTDGPQGFIMVSSIIALAHALGIKVTAEGVETREQAQMLLLLKCDEAQGYHFSRPVPAAGFARMLSLSAPLPLPQA